MALTDQDTINGVPIKSWLNKHDVVSVEKTKIMKEAKEQHYLYKKQNKKYNVRGRSGKCRKLTRQEIIKEYGEKPMTNLKKILNVLNEKDPSTPFSIIYLNQKLPSINPKTLTAIMTDLYGALREKGLMTREGRPYHYKMERALPSVDTMHRIVRDYTNTKKKKSRREQLKKENENMNKQFNDAGKAIEELKIQNREYQKLDIPAEELKHKMMETAEVNIPLKELSGLIRSIIQNEVGTKLKVQIDVRFGVLKD